MNALDQAVATKRAIVFHAPDSSSPVPVLPNKKPNGCFFFVPAVDDARALRICQDGAADMKGGKGGPFAEFQVTSADDSASVYVHGTKSGKWLTVEAGEFASAPAAVPLLCQLSSLAEEENQLESGETVKLIDTGSATALPWSVRVLRKRKVVHLATEDGNVACGPHGKFHTHGGKGAWASWEIDQTGAGMSLKNVGHGKFMSLTATGAPQLSETATFFSTEEAADPMKAVAMPVDTSVLSDADRQHFKEKGYVILKGCIPQDKVDACLRLINHSLGHPGCWAADEEVMNTGQNKLRMAGGPLPFVELFNKTPLWSAINIILGEGNVLPWKGQPQIALRFPQAPSVGNDVLDGRPGTQYHIDGMGQSQLCPFSLLVGVSLSDQTHPESGNLHVFPGSHLHQSLHDYYQQMIDNEEAGEADESKPNLGPSTQVLLAPGDVVVAHQLLAHRVGICTRPSIRYQLFYRVRHVKHKELKHSMVQDPWAEIAI